MDEKSTLILILVTVTILLLLVAIVGILFSVFIKRKNAIIQEQIDAEKRFEKEISETQIEIREETLRNISWELHDNIGQLLTLAKIQTQNAAQGSHLIQEAANTIGKGLEEVRALSKLINPEALKNLSLIEAVQLEVERYNRMGYIKASLKQKGESFEVDDKIQIVIFRVLQEFCSNTIKHSKATRLEIEITYNNPLFKVLAKDNGVGFEYQNEKSKNGIGLSNIEQRGKLIDADITIHSAKGEGTQLELTYQSKHHA